MPAIAAPLKRLDLEARAQETFFPLVEIYFEDGDFTQPRFNLIDYDVVPPDLAELGFLVSKPSFEIDLYLKADGKPFRFNRDPQGLPRLQWALLTTLLNTPLTGVWLRQDADDSLCTLYWNEPYEQFINASILSIFLVDRETLLLSALPLGIGYVPTGVQVGEGPGPAPGPSELGPPTVALKARHSNGRVTYNVYFYKSWGDVHPEPFFRIRHYPFTLELFAEDFEFKPNPHDRQKPSIFWYDPYRKEWISQPEEVEVADLSDSRRRFTMKWNAPKAPGRIASFFVQTQGDFFLDPTVAEDPDENTGPGFVFGR